MDRKSRFRKSLEARQHDLRLSVIQTQKEMLAAQHDYGKDEGDRANTSLAKEMQLGHKSRDRALGAVEAALKRISAGTFGECLNCGQEINAKRLEALPWVCHCITCQELIDGAWPGRVAVQGVRRNGSEYTKFTDFPEPSLGYSH